jgi:hypothetical protein
MDDKRFLTSTHEQQVAGGLQKAVVNRRMKTLVAHLATRVEALSDAIERLSRLVYARAPSVSDAKDDLDIGRTRDQLSRLDTAIDGELAKPEPDAKRLEALARAKATLAELDRRSTGRSLPPTFRASARTKSEPVNRPPPTPL